MGEKDKRIIAALNMIEIAINELNATLPADENRVGSDLHQIMRAAQKLRDKYVKPENIVRGGRVMDVSGKEDSR